MTAVYAMLTSGMSEQPDPYSDPTNVVARRSEITCLLVPRPPGDGGGSNEEGQG